jgi:immune inhibitor A
MVIGGAFFALASVQNVDATIADELKPVNGATDYKIGNYDVIGEGDGKALDIGTVMADPDHKTFLALDTFLGVLTPMEFTKRGENTLCEVWVADNTEFPADDPLERNIDPVRRTITDDMVTRVLSEFSDNVYVTEAEYFGEPLLRDGYPSVSFDGSTYDGFPTDEGKKTMIMILNIRDASYYDPINYGTYVVGFFSSGVDTLYDRNIIQLDCWRWATRFGPQADPYYAYTYDATIAHEYQHLLHNDLDPEEESWLNEGCAMYSEMLCGYGIPYSYLNDFLEYPDNSLTVWGDQGPNAILSDYGAAAMFMIYLNDQFGGSSTISALAHSQLHGTDSVTKILSTMGPGSHKMTFAQVFRDFRMANLMMAPYGPYGYDSLDSAELDDVWTYNYDASQGMVQRSDVTYVMGYGIDAYGTDYFVMSGSSWNNLKKSQYEFKFDGQDTKSTGWQIKDVEGSSYWWSGMGDMKDFWLMSDPIVLGAGDHAFTFNNWYSIEDNWDYGIVQYSTDGTNWNTISNARTSSDALTDVPEILAAIPGLTGYSDGFYDQEYTFTLAESSNVYLRLRYMTDQAANGASDAGPNEMVGWLANNFRVDGSDVAMTETNTVTEDIDFLISFYGEKGNNLQKVRIRDLYVRDIDEVATMPMSVFNGFSAVVIVISPTNGPCDYSFGVVKK